MFPENSEILEFLKRKSFNRKYQKFQKENEMEQKFVVRNLHKFSCSLRVCLLFLKFRKILFHSLVTENFRKFKQFLMEWEALVDCLS